MGQVGPRPHSIITSINPSENRNSNHQQRSKHENKYRNHRDKFNNQQHDRKPHFEARSSHNRRVLETNHQNSVGLQQITELDIVEWRKQRAKHFPRSNGIKVIDDNTDSKVASYKCEIETNSSQSEQNKNLYTSKKLTLFQKLLLADEV